MRFSAHLVHDHAIKLVAITKQMQILFISYAFHPQVGGIESSALMLLREFLQRGHRVKVVTDVACDDGDELTWIDVIRRPGLSTQWRLAREADVIYHHNPAFRYWLPSCTGRSTVFSIHTWVSRADRSISWKDQIKHHVLKRFPCISNSRATAQHLSGESVVIENAYDDSVFRTTTDWSSRDGAVFVGRLVSDKGVPTALRAISNLQERGQPMNLRIIGSGPDEDALKRQAEEIGISDRVQFLGRREPTAVAEELNRAKYLLVPSQWEEPFGIVALEGIACGCIPIGTDRGGLVDAIGPCGPLFEKGNGEQLADWLDRLESEPDLASSYRSNHSSHLDRHSPRVVSERHLEVFENAIGRPDQ